MSQPRQQGTGRFRKRLQRDRAPAPKELTIADLLKPRAIAPTIKRHQSRRGEHDAKTKLQIVRDAERGAARHEANDEVRDLKRAARDAGGEYRMAIALRVIAALAADELDVDVAELNGRAPDTGALTNGWDLSIG